MSSHLPTLRAALLVTLLTMAGAARAQAALDLTGRALLRASQSASAETALRAAAPSDVRIETDAEGRPAVDVFVRLDSPAHVSAAEAAGLVLQTLAGDVAVGRVALARLGALADAAGVQSVSVSRVRPSLWRNEAARTDTRVNAVHAGTGLPRAYTGTGVVVGVVDSGIDYDHPAFVAEGGNPGLVRLLELLPNTGQREFTQAEITARTVTEVDPNGHGTHVAGTAAGGRATANRPYYGVAPGAELVAVKADRAGTTANGGFADADVIAAVQYVFAYATQRSMPAVVNLSLGGHNGGHDGTSNYERALDALAGPGRIIVAAAGNEGTYTFHAGTAVAAGTTYEALFSTTTNPTANEPLSLYGYAPPGGVTTLQPALYSVGAGGALTLDGRAAQPVAVAPGMAQATGTIVDAGGQTLASFTVDAMTDPNNNDLTFQLAFTTAGASLTDADNKAFGLAFGGTAAGRVDMWLGRDNGSNRFVTSPPASGTATRIAGDALLTVGQPASARRVISVGAYNTTNAWTDIDGNAQTTNGPDGQPVPLGARADFSSAGPTRDGRTGVDVSAPGNVIASAYSQDTPPQSGNRSRLLAGGLHNYVEGTSMASPHISGIVALMLQARPTLDPEAVLQIFQQTARTDANTGTVPNTLFGRGKVDALAAMQTVVAVAGEGTARAIGLTLDAPAPNPVTWQSAVAFTLPASGPARLALYDVLGREVAVLAEGTQDAGPHRATLAAGHLSAGTYVLRLTAGGDTVARPVVVVR